MKINDSGIILGARKYNENSLIVKIFAQNNGIYSGFIRGALSSKKNNSLYQIANLVEFDWSARQEEDLGFLKIEPVKSFLGEILSDPIKLNCITGIMRIVEQNVPERQENQGLFAELLNLLHNLNAETADFLACYIKFEIYLLENLGYGIDLSKCAVTGLSEDLYFVSPKSGRAVSKSAGEKWAGKLLKLPLFLQKHTASSLHKNDLLDGLQLSGFFIDKYLYKSSDLKLPDTRQRISGLIKDRIFGD